MEYFNNKHETVSLMRANEYDLKSMNSKFLRLICEKSGLYLTPNLNSSLNLGGKGFKIIENLEEYYNLTTIYLHNNAIYKIENLNIMKNLKCLFLQNNLIKKIEGLEDNIYLDTLDLSNNDIKKIENLEKNINLTKLVLNKNIIKDYEDLENLENYDNLMTIDLSQNLIDYDEKVPKIFFKMKNIRTIYLNNNPIKNKISNYRKYMIANTEKLTYLDNRPVRNEEKRFSIAFMKGGKEGEDQERVKLREEKQKVHKSYIKEIDNRKKEARERAIKNLNNRITSIEEKKIKINIEIEQTDEKIKELESLNNDENKENLEINDEMIDDIQIQKNLKNNLETKINEYDEYIDEIKNYKEDYEDKNYDFNINTKVRETENKKEIDNNLLEEAYIPGFKEEIILKNKELEEIKNNPKFEWNKEIKEELEILLEDNFFNFDKVSELLKIKFENYKFFNDEISSKNLKLMWKSYEDEKYDINIHNKNYYEELD